MEIGVYGLGRFGYFWAGLLSRFFKVKAYSRNPERLTPEKVERVTEEKLLECNVIFFCNAISSFEEVIKNLSGKFNPGTLVMDTCSVKVIPAKIMSEYLPESVEIIATHPMFGPDSAKISFKGLPIIIWPVRVKDKKYKEWFNFFNDIGLRTIKMSPEDHDYQAAYTQGITHYVGRVLADLNLKPSEIGTVGYNKLLEIMEQTCNDPWQLFMDLQRFNPFTKEMREKLHDSLDIMLKKLESSLDIS
jgi:prephenate dehydrogenase